MALSSARFRGEPRLEAILTDGPGAFLRFGTVGDHVRAVQLGLIDLGFNIPSGATGNFLNETSAAVKKFKIQHTLRPTDPVVGVGTMTALDDEWALPFADREEFLSWSARLIPEFNFTRRDELLRLQTGGQFTLHPLSSWFPAPFRDALFTGLAGLLDPRGSPNASFTPSATWGASPLDLMHCHVVVDLANGPGWSVFQPRDQKIHNRILSMMREADLSGPEGTPPWTAAYRDLLLAPGRAGQPSFQDQVARYLNDLLANANAVQQTLKLVWHTFEVGLWRPAGMASNDPRRSWWNDVTPVPGAVTSTPFAPSDFGANVFELFELGFLVDHDLVVTVHGQTRTEAAALVGLDKARIDAATLGLPFP